MFSFFRKSRRKKKAATKPAGPAPKPGNLNISTEDDGYNPYDTLPGVSRDKFGMRRKGNGKWTF